jgi:hypothetical protein
MSLKALFSKNLTSTQRSLTALNSRVFSAFANHRNSEDNN